VPTGDAATAFGQQQAAEQRDEFVQTGHGDLLLRLNASVDVAFRPATT
jgi:hypothetical protein